MTTDNTQELDKILAKVSSESFDAAINNPNDYMLVLNAIEVRAKQALLDWHDKRVEAVLDGLKEEGISCIDPAGHPTYVVPLSAIEAERNKLKESK